MDLSLLQVKFDRWIIYCVKRNQIDHPSVSSGNVQQRIVTKYINLIDYFWNSTSYNLYSPVYQLTEKINYWYVRCQE